MYCSLFLVLLCVQTLTYFELFLVSWLVVLLRFCFPFPAFLLVVLLCCGRHRVVLYRLMEKPVRSRRNNEQRSRPDGIKKKKKKKVKSRAAL